jgi:hypothetical protein
MGDTLDRYKLRWFRNPMDLRYRICDAVIRSLPVAVGFVVVSGVTQWHTNATFDGNELHNLAEGGGVTAVTYALFRLLKK